MPQVKRSSPEYYAQLKQHFVKILLSAAFIPLILIGGILYYHFSATLKENSLRYVENLVRDHQDEIDGFLSERISNLKALSKSHTMDYLVQGNHLSEVFNILQGEYGTFTELGVIDAAGNHVAYVGPYKLLGKNYKDAPWFKEVMDRGEYVSDVFLGMRRVPHIIMAVKRVENSRTWILRTTLDTAKFSDLVESIRIGKTVDAFIVNTEGILQTRPRSGGNLLEKSDFLPGKYTQGIRLKEKKDELGTRFIYAYTWLQNRNWCLVVKQDLREVYAALRHINYVIIPIFIGGSFFIVFAAIFTTRQLASRIEKTAREKDMLNEQLLQSGKLAAIGELAAGIAHEINNPLAIIGEEAGWMKDLLKKEVLKGSPKVTEFEDSISQIGLQARRCRQITHNLLAFARKLEPKMESFGLNNLIEDVIKLVEREARVNDIIITRNFYHELPPVWTDASQLRQVFLNLVNNAMDAIGRKGEITITTRLGLDSVCAEVADTGHGIAEEDLDKIFLPFFTTKAPGKGTGLGLAISYSVIEKLGGRITVNSAEGKGTTFSVCLPLGRKG
ncbi:MAG: ATP-binding protein [Thermodesulfobacteriota bacterium]|nr:ATP-binding protein [Thermodesulfobacteriota bacterium]